MKKRAFLPFLLIGIGLLIIFTAVIIGIQPQAQTSTPQPVVSEEESPRVSLEEALLAYKAGSAVFVDIRDKSAYEAAHISGSLSFPLAQLESQLKKLDPKAWIITYCT